MLTRVFSNVMLGCFSTMAGVVATLVFGKGLAHFQLFAAIGCFVWPVCWAFVAHFIGLDPVYEED